MLKILIAVDGSDHANRAIEAVGKMARSALDLEAILICVSPEPLFYGNYTAAIAPTLDGLGVDGDGGHTLEERLYISSIVPRTRLLMRLMETLR